MTYLNRLRRADKPMTMPAKVINTLLVLIFGAVSGVLTKALDAIPANELPPILEYADIANFFGRFAVWLLIGICICFYSNSPLRAAANVFVFFLGMVSAYYLYTEFVFGFFPKSYALVWFAFTALSPFLALVCSLAKGEGRTAFAVCAAVIAVLFNTVFVYVRFYFEARSIAETAVFFIGLIVLKRATFKETVQVTALGVGIAFILNLLIPFRFG